MESSNYNTILSKWGRMKKKPQPMTDLTSLYSKVANESIYYLKLEEYGDLKRALQGWKALNTDVLYQLTVIDHTYPNIQNYTKDEISIKNGVRELYHKASSHLERVQAKVSESSKHTQSNNELFNSDRVKQYDNRTNSIKSTSSISPASSLVKKSYTLSSPNLHNHSKKMVRTLRNSRDTPNKHALQQPHYKISAPIISRSLSPAKVNFTVSKPLGVQNQLYPNKSNSSTSSIDNEVHDHNPILAPTRRAHSMNEKLLIDLDSDESDSNDDSNDSQNDTSFEIESYYESYLNIDDKQLERLKTLEQLSSAEKTLSDLSIKSTPLIPSASFDPDQNCEKPKNDTKTTKTKKIAKNKVITKEELTRSVPSLPMKKKVIKSKIPTSVSVDVIASKSVSSTKVRSSTPKSTLSKNPNQLGKSSVKTTRPMVRNEKPQTSTQSSVRRIPKQSTSNNTSTTQNSNKTKKLVKKATDKNVRPTTSSKTVQKKKSPIPTNKVSSGQQKSSTSKASVNNTTKEEIISVEEIEMTKEKLEDEIIDLLQGVDKTAAKQIFSEIVVQGDEVHWEDVVGLESAKSSLKEAVVYPFLRPDLFRGLREPVRGMLLFGPPGTGKTMIARAVATESNSTFFSISASSLTSKYLGESEKLVRALFAVAKKLAPSIIFVDEIDSIMGSRDGDGENESSRRIKNEFLIQWSSLSSAAAGKNSDSDDERVLLLAATNLPWSIDEAARRRFVRRQYIPLPENSTRKAHLKKLLTHQRYEINEEEFEELVTLTVGFSGSDITSLAKDAAMGPLRELGEKLLDTSRDQIRPITLNDFKSSLEYIKPSVSQEGLQRYVEWADKFGSSGV